MNRTEMCNLIFSFLHNNRYMQVYVSIFQVLAPDVRCSYVPDVRCSYAPDVRCSYVPDVRCSSAHDVRCSYAPDVRCSYAPDVRCSNVPDVSFYWVLDVRFCLCTRCRVQFLMCNMQILLSICFSAYAQFQKLITPTDDGFLFLSIFEFPRQSHGQCQASLLPSLVGREL